ncbi:MULTISPECIES: succinoglycan biosynthesis transport protein [Rhizobium]|uniref:succinoglycan biosynthesis transport protein n=1 Tax=Rhizobium TaxID=379 RepID=UPI001958B7FF|nr:MULTISPECIES: succinoglycan biosynthesis transport protein [Rhizobium]MBM7044651.1 succinoglycan biosynthesis transport protein [Rhizobium lusitanum]
MSESKARLGFYPDDAEAFEVSRGPHRRVSSHREDNGPSVAAHLRAANSDDPRDAELRAILRRMLDGDPYPVSGRRASVAEASQQAQSLTEHISSILSHRHIDEPISRPSSEAGVDLLEFVPDLLDGETGLPALAATPAPREQIPPPRRRTFGIGSIGLVIAASLAGAAIPTMLAPPPLYMSQTILHAEGEGRARQALLDVAAKRAVAPSALSDVVARLKLDRDPEFTGSRAGALGVAVELLSGNGNASDAPSRAQAALRKGVAVSVDGSTGLLRLAVTTGDPVRSAEIANRLAVATTHDAAVAQAAGTPALGDTAADDSRKELERASAALAGFKAQYGEDRIAAALTLQEQRQQLDSDIKAAGLAVRSAKARVSAVKSATPASVLGGALPGDLASAALDDLRSRYNAAKAQLTQLSTQLGPRHPRLLAQQATVDDLSAGIRSQLQRLVVSSDAALKAALESQQALSARMTALSQKSVGVDVVRLAQLQDAVTAAQSRYEADQQSPIIAPPEAGAPMTVVSPAAAAPLDNDLVGNQAIGFLGGLGLALCLVFLRKWLTGAAPTEDDAIGDAAVPATALQHDIELEFPSTHDAPDEPVAAPMPEIGSRPAGADEWTRIHQELAFLRAKVQTYAAHRHVGRG